MEVPKFQTKISINMVLLEVFEFFAMIHLDSGPILLIYYVFCDVRKVLWVIKDLLKFFVSTVYSIDQINQPVFFDTFDFYNYIG